MSQHLDEPTQTSAGNASQECAYNQEDVARYYQASLEIKNNRHHIEDAREQVAELEHSEAVELFKKQVGLLQKRLANDPQFFQQTFITEGTTAIAWEFQQDELGETFIHTLWGAAAQK